MTLQLSHGATTGRDLIRPAALLASPWLAVVLVGVAIAQQLIGHLNCDVSWFITFAEKYLDGAIPYVDVTDPNPPAAFLANAPAVWIARKLHVAVEPVVAALIFFFAFVSIGLAATILRHGARRSREYWGLLLNAAIFLFLVVPAFAFAEREHIAVLALLPMLATLAARSEGGSIPAPSRLLAGLFAGLALCFKPFFALPLILPATGLAWREASPRVLFTAEMATAALVTLAYALLTLALFPAYAHYAVPVITDVYQASRLGASQLAFVSLAPINVLALAGLALASAGSFAHPPVKPAFVASAASWVCALASAGFLVTFFLQGKGWPNHAYPGIAMAFLAWIFFALDRHPRALARREQWLFRFLFVPLFVASPAMFGIAMLLANAEEYPGLRAAITQLAPAHPRVIALAKQLSYGHPVTRQLAGEWVGRPNALWTASFAGALLSSETDPARRERLQNYRRQDISGFAQDVRAGRPDVIIVADKATRDFGLQQPEIAEVLADYAKAGEAGEVEVWTRQAR
jgi:hypothetical protein